MSSVNFSKFIYERLREFHIQSHTEHRELLIFAVRPTAAFQTPPISAIQLCKRHVCLYQYSCTHTVSCLLCAMYERERGKKVSRPEHVLMVVCKRSPGIPSDDRRFVDIWGDDSLTISESSLTSENVVTVVEVHAAKEVEKQDETTVDETPDDELDEEKVELDDKEGLAASHYLQTHKKFSLDIEDSALNFAIQETTEAQADGGDESKENIEELAEQEERVEEDQKEAEEAVVDVAESKNLDEICKLTPLSGQLSTNDGEFFIRCSDSRAR
jgi:hypothetical protein